MAGMEALTDTPMGGEMRSAFAAAYAVDRDLHAQHKVSVTWGKRAVHVLEKSYMGTLVFRACHLSFPLCALSAQLRATVCALFARAGGAACASLTDPCS